MLAIRRRVRQQQAAPGPQHATGGSREHGTGHHNGRFEEQLHRMAQSAGLCTELCAWLPTQQLTADVCMRAYHQDQPMQWVERWHAVPCSSTAAVCRSLKRTSWATGASGPPTYRLVGA
eukprot:353077-Chlamydomonas_euryale.AAC.14